MAPASMPAWPPRWENSGIRARPTSAKTPTSTALHRVPMPGHCRSGIHRSSTRKLYDHHDCADAQPGLDRQSLVEHVPRVQPKSGADEHGQGYAVHGAHDKELKEPAGHHGPHPSGKLALHSIASLKYWLYVRIPEPQFARPAARPMEPRRRPPAYRELADVVRLLVLDGRVPLDVALPSERALAATLGISRTTVTAAYSLLREQGFLSSGQGSRGRTCIPRSGEPGGRKGGSGANLRQRCRPWPFRTGSSTSPMPRCRPAARWCTGRSPPR